MVSPRGVEPLFPA